MANTRANQAATAADSKLQEFFEDQLQDIYWAEKKLVKTLPKMQEAATGNELKNAIGNHLEQTRTHVTRLEDIFLRTDVAEKFFELCHAHVSSQLWPCASH